MTAISVAYLFAALAVKHLICDFLLQAHPYQYLNKGTYGHPGGILHSGIHFIGTLIVLSFFLPLGLMLLLMSLFDMVVHYHVDYAKVNISKKCNLKPDNSEWFWILLGIDQFLHTLTYLAIVVVII